MGSLFSKEFRDNMERYIVSTSDQLLDLIAYIEKNHIEDPVILVDEAGASLNAADWFEAMNRAIVKTFTIIGWLKPTILFLAPNKDFILSSIRKMSHWLIKVSRSSNDYSTIIPYEQIHSSLDSKPISRKPRILFHGRLLKLTKIKVMLPPKSIDDKYDLIEKARKPLMISEIREDMIKTKNISLKPAADIDQLTEFVVQNPEKFSSGKKRTSNEWKIDADIIENKFQDRVIITPKIAKKIRILAKYKLAARKEGIIDG